MGSLPHLFAPQPLAAWTTGPVHFSLPVLSLDQLHERRAWSGPAKDELIMGWNVLEPFFSFPDVGKSVLVFVRCLRMDLRRYPLQQVSIQRNC